LVLITNFILLS